MTPKQKIKASKFLSLLLRHKPEVGNLTLDAQGWADVPAVIASLQAHGHPVTLSILREIVVEDAKQRYAFDGHESRIRANQGHSLAVDLGLEQMQPPSILYHGTAHRSLGLIWRDGLKPMERAHVHLSETYETALSVGKRHGQPVVLRIDAAGLAATGHVFYQSANHVWLTDAVPVAFLSLIDGAIETAQG